MILIRYHTVSTLVQEPHKNKRGVFAEKKKSLTGEPPVAGTVLPGCAVGGGVRDELVHSLNVAHLCIS